jgi:hypothetical protein
VCRVDDEQVTYSDRCAERLGFSDRDVDSSAHDGGPGELFGCRRRVGLGNRPEEVVVP